MSEFLPERKHFSRGTNYFTPSKKKTAPQLYPLRSSSHFSPDYPIIKMVLIFLIIGWD
jgi:hypothetical protein